MLHIDGVSSVPAHRIPAAVSSWKHVLDGSTRPLHAAFLKPVGISQQHYYMYYYMHYYMYYYTYTSRD